MNTGIPMVAQLDISELDASNFQNLGAVLSTGDGRRYKKVKFALSAAVPAGTAVYATPATASSIAIPAQKAVNLAKGSKKIVLTASSAVSADQFAGGYLSLVVAGDSSKYSLEIESNTGAATGKTFVVVLKDALQNVVPAIAGKDTVTIYTGTHSAVSTTATGNLFLGLSVNAVPAGSATTPLYGYVQSEGFSAVTGAYVAPVED